MNRCKKIAKFKKDVFLTVALKGSIPAYAYQQKIKELVNRYNIIIKSAEVDCKECKEELLDLGALCFN